VREDGVVDYDPALRILFLAIRDEYLRGAILRFVVQEFRDDLRRMPGLSLYSQDTLRVGGYLRSS